MALDISLRRWLLLPRFIQTGNGEPRKAHFLGKKQATPVEGNQQPGGKNDQPPKQTGTEKYRRLDSISIGEVKQVLDSFAPQLVASPVAEWVAENYFCQLPLNRHGQDRPSAVFGRVKTCFPGDGNVQNIEEMELYFPRPHAAPDVLHLRADDLALHKPIYSFCVGVKAYLSEAEQMDFSRSENIFIEKGFAPLYNTGYGELLDVNEQNHSSLPWLFILGSEWFASIPDTLQPEIREKLRSLAGWDKMLLNYHPKRYSLQYRSLNEELDFNYGFTRHYLTMPQDTNQTLTKLDEKFGEKFMLRMG